MWDVLIAGAGPAGSVAGTILARAGARVLMVDRARFPRSKLCGDSISPGTLAVLRRLNLANRLERRGSPIEGWVLTGPRGARVEGRYPKPLLGRAVSRSALDCWLLEDAIAAGVEFEERVVVRKALIHQEGSGRSDVHVDGILVRGHHARDVALRARVTIAADGRRSPLAFGLGLVRHPMRPRRWAVGAYFDGVTGMSSLGELHIRPGHYLGVASLPDGVTNVCLAGSRETLTCMSSPEQALRVAIDRDEALRERFAGARVVAPPAVLGPLAIDAKAAGLPGLLLAGDAAGFIDPMTGDGLRFAVRGGELAAEAAVDMLATGSVDGHVVLARRRRDAFSWKWRFNRTMRQLIDCPVGLTTGVWVSRLAPQVIRSFISMAGDCGDVRTREAL